MKKSYIFLIIGFVIIYSVFIFGLKLNVTIDIVAQLIVASVFFFALFSSFFITRQNNRYNQINDIIAERDGLYSYLYRVFSMIPRVQNEVREIIRQHYTKILNSNNWAYNEFHSSSTITKITKSMSNLTAEERAQIAGSSPFDGIWQQICQLQQNRKKIIATYQQRLVVFQWILIYIFAGLVIASFNFLQTSLFWVNILKIIFGTSVFLVVLLIKQLDNLSIFGKDFSRIIAQDVLRIIDEADMREIENKKT